MEVTTPRIHYTKMGLITPGGKGAVKVWVDSPTENNSLPKPLINGDEGKGWKPVQPVALEGHDGRGASHPGRR